jgi:hypothetical protein
MVSGAIVDIRTCESDRTENYEQYSVPIRLGHYRTRPTNAAILVAIAAARKTPGGTIGKPVPNVTGQRQTVCHVFPDAIPDRDEQPHLEDVEAPGQHTGPVPTVDHTGRPVTRQSDRPYLIWWLMNQQPCRDMVSDLQLHDRDDLRQDMALKYWRQSVKQEANGKKITNPAWYIAKAVAEWIGKNIETAQGDPLTQQQRDDAVDALDAQRRASEESRLQKREAELKIEQARFLAALTAERDAKNPVSVFCFKW